MSDELKEAGLALFRQGRRQEAIQRFEEAAASYAATGDLVGQGEALNNIGVLQRMEQRWTEAEMAFSQATDLFAAAGDPVRQAQVLGNQADLYAFRGEPEAAARSYSDAAAVMAKAGDHEKQAQLLRALSLLRLRQRRLVEAVMLMEQSLAVRPHPNPLQRIFLALLRVLGRLMGHS